MTTPKFTSTWLSVFWLPVSFALELFLGSLIVIYLVEILIPLLGEETRVLFLFLFGVPLLYLTGRRLILRVRTGWSGAPPKTKIALVGFGLIGLPACALLLNVWMLSTFKSYMAKPRQSDAKFALASLFSQQQNRFSNKGIYSLRIRDLDYATESRKSHYLIGSPIACLEKFGLKPEEGILDSLDSPFAAGRKEEMLQFFKTVRKPDECKDPKQGFELYAVGIIRMGGGFDVWRIDEKKNLENVQRGY